MKSIVLHSGFNSCERCEIVGTYVNSRVIFLPEENMVKRDELVFNNFGYPNHQKDQTPLVEAGISCIKAFALDYMHLVCLGVVRRLIRFLKSGKKGRISMQQRTHLSNLHGALNGCLPTEFARQPRQVNDVDRWKATEFCFFLLYTGPVVLKRVLSNEQYKHFLSSSIAISILLTDNIDIRSQYINYARKLINYFVSKSPSLYGECFVVYNVHNLLHLVDDVEHHKCSINDICCFPYENHMQRLKKEVRNAKSPIIQVCEREHEYDNVLISLPKKKESK